MSTDTCVENYSTAFLKVLAMSNPKRIPRDDPLPPKQDGIQDDIGMKNWLQGQ